MKITVCELSDERDLFDAEWEQLILHVSEHKSDLLVLPELIFSEWFADYPEINQEVWDRSIADHANRINALHSLYPTIVAGSAPVLRNGLRLNEGFLLCNSYKPVHSKHYLPREEGFYESSWFSVGDKDFSLATLADIKIGFAICSEMWFMSHIQDYGRKGAHIIISPRASIAASRAKWLVGGQANAVVSGAFSVSSNRKGRGGLFGGEGWIIDPDGNILALTSSGSPFVTLDVDISIAERAKHTYPRDIPVMS